MLTAIVRTIRAPDLLIAFSMGVLMPWSAHAAEELGYPPDSVPGIATVTADRLANMLAGDNPPVLIDARIAKGRDKGIIEGSIWLSDIETDCESLAHLAPDRATALVFYCTSSKCGRSLNSVKTAQNCGYRNVLWFRGGFAEWQSAGLPYLKAIPAGAAP